MELKNFGINVCVVCPGDVKTNFTKNRIKNYDTNEKYGNHIEKASSDLDSKEHKRMSPKIVAKEIFKASNKSKTKPLVIVGTKYKVLYVLQRFFPVNLILKLIEKFFGGY
jgi:short-subunit dehydrogenase